MKYSYLIDWDLDLRHLEIDSKYHTNEDAVRCFRSLRNGSHDIPKSVEPESVVFNGCNLDIKIIFKEIGINFYPKGILSVNGESFY